MQNICLLLDVAFALGGSLPRDLVEHHVEEQSMVRGYDDLKLIVFIF